VNHLLISYHTCPLEEPGMGLAGGMNVFLRGLLAGLGPHGIRTDVLTRGKGTEEETTLPYPGVRIFHIPCARKEPPSRASAWEALPRFIEGAKEWLARSKAAYGAVSAHYWMSGVAWLGMGDTPGVSGIFPGGCRPPVVFMYHTVEARKEGPEGGPGDFLRRRRMEEEERLAGASARIVFLSRHDFERTGKLFPEVAGKGVVIPPGVDEAFRRLPPRQEARKKLGIPSEAFLFLLAARPDPGKNVEAAITAFRALRAESGERVRLLIAGQALPGPGLPEGATCAGTVPHAEMPALFSAADAVLCPSSYESFGLVPLEAMAGGVPVIVPEGGFWGEKIQAEGGGLTYPRGGDKGLAEAMRSVYGDKTLRSLLSEGGRRIASRFTWENCTASWAWLLPNVARPGSPR